MAWNVILNSTFEKMGQLIKFCTFWDKNQYNNKV